MKRMAPFNCYISLLIVVLTVLSATASQIDNTFTGIVADEFRLWKARFNKNYKNQADEETRFFIWRKNKVTVDGVNGNSNSTWTGK